MRTDVMGVGFDSLTADEALNRAMELVERHRAAVAVTPNAEILYDSMHNPELAEVLNRAELVLPDGAGVVLAARLLKTPIRQKIAGIDFAAALAGRLAQAGKTLYLLGSRPGVAEAAVQKLTEANPGLIICGTADGYFSDEEPVIRAINRVRPDVVFVCLGAPKQEFFMSRCRSRLDVGLMIGLGGSLDGFAGNVKRAPKWMQRCGLEWFYRLLRQPSRIRRMMRLPKFLLAVLKRRISGS